MTEPFYSTIYVGSSMTLKAADPREGLLRRFLYVRLADNRFLKAELDERGLITPPLELPSGHHAMAFCDRGDLSETEFEIFAQSWASLLGD